MVCLLYHEAKKKVLSGRYPFSQDECDSLGAIQFLITDLEQQREQRPATEPFGDSPEYFRLLHNYLKYSSRCQ